MPNKYLSQDQALAKIQRYCVFQDRCHAEVRSKLIEWGVYGDTLEEILSTLISDNFLNEERFALETLQRKGPNEAYTPEETQAPAATKKICRAPNTPPRRTKTETPPFRSATWLRN